jgi:hypothetical protein
VVHGVAGPEAVGSLCGDLTGQSSGRRILLMRAVVALVVAGMFAAAIGLLGACTSILGVEQLGSPVAFDGGMHDASDGGSE